MSLIHFLGGLAYRRMHLFIAAGLSVRHELLRKTLQRMRHILGMPSDFHQRLPTIHQKSTSQYAILTKRRAKQAAGKTNNNIRMTVWKEKPNRLTWHFA
eukprot:6475618-Amphidinium_carterae.1